MKISILTVLLILVFPGVSFAQEYSQTIYDQYIDCEQEVGISIECAENQLFCSSLELEILFSEGWLWKSGGSSTGDGVVKKSETSALKKENGGNPKQKVRRNLPPEVQDDEDDRGLSSGNQQLELEIYRCIEEGVWL